MDTEQQTIWCVQVCDFEACWYERIYDSREEAEKHFLDYELKEHEESAEVVQRNVDRAYRG